MTDPLTQQMPSFGMNGWPEATTMYKDFKESRYIIAAEVTDPTESPKMVFLAHSDKTFYWTATGSLPLICFGDTLIEMKPLMDKALHETTAQIDNLQLINIRPYLVSSTLSACYDEYLTQVKEAEDKELFERYDKMLSDGFSDDERLRIQARV